jgi:glycosyltransferase involved in cell wall biosynthesis
MRTSMKTGPRVAHVATIDLTVHALLLPQLRGLRDAGYEVTAVSAPGPFVPLVAAAGIRHIAWRHATRAWDPRSDLLALRELAGILRRERFDIVHTHNAKPGVMGRIAARLAGVPCVANTVHGFDATPDDGLAKRVAFMGAERVAALFSDLELYQSRADLRRAVRTALVPSSKAVFLGNGTDLSRFDPRAVDVEVRRAVRAEIGIEEGVLVVGIIGRLVGDKGYRELFQAARAVRACRPDIRFLAVGDRDPAKADGLTQAEIEEAGRDFVFLGWRSDVPSVLSAMDVFVLPSWREGVPRSAIEAAAMGKPLIVSDIPGCRQVVTDGLEGILVPPRDPEALASAILRLAKDPDLRSRMGAAARATAEERFDERRVVTTILDQYDRVLARKRVSA